MRIKVITCWLLTLLSICSTFGLPTKQFQHKVLKSGWFTHTVKTNYIVDNQSIGFISSTKILSKRVYVLYSFYIYPPCRNKGYGRELLIHTCSRLKRQGAKMIFIQPGPFELTESGNMKTLDADEYAARLKKLIAFYKSCGFKMVSGFLSPCASLLYKIIGIPEDSSYLHVMKIH